MNLKPVHRYYFAVIYFLLVLFLLFGCSSTAPTIIEKPVVVTVPEIKDTTIVLRDTVFVKDSLWYGEVTDSLGKVIGDLKVYFKKKIAELKLNERKDTVYIEVPAPVDSKPNLPAIVVNALSWWEKGILFGMTGLALSLITYLRIKRGKIL